MRYPLVADGHLTPAAIEAAVACLRAGQYSMGAHVRRFEAMAGDAFGSPHAVMVNSGSSALLLAWEVLLRPSWGAPGLRVGDEVLVPALGWSTTVWPLIQLGLKPVFVDSEPETLGMDLEQAAAKITPRTKAICYVYPAGLAIRAPQVRAFAFEHQLYLVEDACEAVGATVDGKAAGTFGHLGTFSHYYSHQLPTIEGGLVLTPNEVLAEDLRAARAHGWDRDRKDKRAEKDFRFVTTGYNVRPMDLQGAIGCAQLPMLKTALTWRRVHAQRIARTLERLPGVHLVGADYVTSEAHSWMFAPILVDRNRDAVRGQFELAGIETRPLLAGNLLAHPALSDYPEAGDFPIADYAMTHGFMIGCHGVEMVNEWELCSARLEAQLCAA